MPENGHGAESGEAVAPTLVVGEALVDVLTDGQGVRRPTPGGSPANVALGLARLGSPVRLATRIGDDAYGALVRDHLTGDGVVLVDGSVAAGPTATAVVTLDQDGVPAYTFDLRWELPTRMAERLRGGAAGCTHLHTGSLAASLEPGAAQVVAAARAARPYATVSYDPNLRPSLLGTPDAERPRVEALVSAADLVKASAEDLDWLYPDLGAEQAAVSWVERGPALVVLTRGGAGATAFWRHGSCAVPAVPVDVADTVGAGDAFMAGLLHGLLTAGLLGGDGGLDGDGLDGDGEGSGDTAVVGRDALRAATQGPQLPPPLLAALRLAADAGAATCSRPGADPPSADELRVFGRLGTLSRPSSRL
ncbi:PfkB family carbohydrate kinase [Streptacidiphilus fuscans]|uniref:Carbohydrate kinase n=1 Tax=Streptacidiphilus fuscans TaxID=2789292 RepID=A0A931B9W7_9ACTN|nr:PfkB family carbohydrate kinase [Streptacidiphilus fuscans]MBF9069555.1 carbohydrate kinase [Streptacidiphilus fuscans]